MKTIIKKLFLFGVLCPAFSVIHSGLPHKLLVGDNVPVLQIDKWIKGGPVNVYEARKVYLVDFWAVWCGPCIASMGHLSDWQKKYKNDGFEVIGATNEDAWGNSYEKVIEFLNSKGQSFNYNFAWLPESFREDRKYKAIIYHPWFIAAYDTSMWALPQVFLIDRNGKIAFIGDGYTLTQEYLEKVLQNKHDIALERQKYIAKVNIENETPRFAALLEGNKIQDALNLGNKILLDENTPAHALLVICDYIFNKNLVSGNKEMLSLGLKAAKKGVEITHSQSPGQLAVLAKAYSVTDDIDGAISSIKAAIVLADGEFKEALEKDLRTYENQGK